MADGYADGSVVVSTDLDTQGFEAGSNKIKSAISSLNNKFNSLGTVFKQAMTGNTKSIAAFEAKAELMQSLIDKIAVSLDAFSGQTITADWYKDLTKDIEKAEKALFKLYDRRDKLESLGVDQQSRSWRNLAYDIENAERNLERLEAQKAQADSTGSHISRVYQTDEYMDMFHELTNLQSQLNEYRENVAGAEIQTSRLPTILRQIGSIGARAFMSVGKRILSAVKSVNLFNKHLKSSKSSLNAVNKLTKAFTSFGSRIKSLLKRRFISALVSGATQGIKDLAQVSPELNAALSMTMTALGRLKNSFASAFAPIITIVAPILTTLINLLSDAFTKVGMLISALTGATSFKRATTVQKDFAASLNGTSKAADKASKSIAGFDELNNTSSSSSSSNEASGTNPADMFEDVPIDTKIANLASRIKSAFTSGDFEGIGAAVASKINRVMQDINDAINWNNVGPKISAFVEGFTRTFNSLVDNIDWALIGDTVAQGVNTITNTVYLLVTGIDWANLGKSLMQGLNGFIHGVNWSKLGKTLGTAFQAVISFLHSVVHNFDFMSLASGLGDAINNAFAAVDWGMLGDTLSTGVRNAFQFITTTVKTIDWRQIGTDVATFLNNIDWAGILGDLASLISSLLSGAFDLIVGFVENVDWFKLGTDLFNALSNIVQNIDWTGLISKAFELLGAAVAGAASFIAGFFTALWEGIKTGWYAVKDYIGEKVKEAGGNIWQGVLDGICEGLVTIGTWIKENIFDPFINGFKSIFGIHSPSTVMAELGGYLIQGLLNGISGAWTAIKTFFTNAWDTIKTVCTTAWNGIKSACKSAWDSVTSTVSESATRIKSWVSDKFNAAKDAVVEKVNKIKDHISEGFSNAWTTVSSKVGEIKDWISTGFSDMVTTVSSKVGEIKDWISTGFSDMVTTVSDKISDISDFVFDGFSDVYTTVIDTLVDVKDCLKEDFTSMVTTVSDKVGSIKDFISTGFSNIYTSVTTSVSNVWSSVSGTFTNLASNAWGWGQDICANISNGLSAASNWVRNGASNIASIIHSFLGFSEPETGPLSDFHTYMPDMIQLMAEGINKNKSIALNAVSDLARGISDEAQDTNVLIPIDTENKYTNFLDSFSDKITGAFESLISKLEAIAGSVTFAVPAIAEGTVVPYKLAQYGSDFNDRGDEYKPVDISAITGRIDKVVDKLDEVVEAIDNKETGISDEDIYASVKSSARKETKSTGRNPFTE